MNAKLILAALAAATLALPAVAGPFGPFGTYGTKNRDFKNEEKEYAPPVKSSGLKAQQRDTRGGFEYVGGEAGWQLIPHTLTWAGGRFVHSDKCDHVVRTAKAPTPQEVEAARLGSPG